MIRDRGIRKTPVLQVAGMSEALQYILSITVAD